MTDRTTPRQFVREWPEWPAALQVLAEKGVTAQHMTMLRAALVQLADMGWFRLPSRTLAEHAADLANILSAQGCPWQAKRNTGPATWATMEPDVITSQWWCVHFYPAQPDAPTPPGYRWELTPKTVH